MPKLYVIAGEDSGDLHGSNLLKALKQQLPEVTFRGVGGDNMQAEGMQLSAHIKDTNFMGFWEVITHLNTIRKLFARVKADIRSWQPDAVILIDYPGFNLRMARFVHGLGIPVVYYISPQLWAWKKGRVKKIRRYVDRMMVILPFEQEFYAREGVEVEFVGHPLLDVIGEISLKTAPSEQPLIALLPGSRKQEIGRMLPLMLQLIPRFPQARFVVAGAPSQPEAFYRQLMAGTPAGLWMNRTYELLQQADFALVTSGTATLETALHRVPQVVCYKGSTLSYLIGKRLIQVPYISLVNLIMGRQVVTELIQQQVRPHLLEAELRALMQPQAHARLQADYAELRQKLGQAGASARAARVVGEVLHSRVGARG